MTAEEKPRVLDAAERNEDWHEQVMRKVIEELARSLERRGEEP